MQQGWANKLAWGRFEKSRLADW